MRPLSHRDPGLVGVALTRDDVAVPIIVDGIHLATEAVLLTWRAAGRRLVLVTDATAAAGMADGAFALGEVAVAKVGVEVRRADGTLAGSALTMDAAVRNAVTAGVPPADALHAASTAPAALLGEAGRGRIAPGLPADVVVLDDDLAVVRTLLAGAQIA
jgi:N-acetylglucosamine-6-phosphate deacetylase